MIMYIIYICISIIASLIICIALQQLTFTYNICVLITRLYLRLHGATSPSLNPGSCTRGMCDPSFDDADGWQRVEHQRLCGAQS